MGDIFGAAYDQNAYYNQDKQHFIHDRMLLCAI